MASLNRNTRSRNASINHERTPLVVDNETRGRMRSYTADAIISQHNRLVQRHRQDSIASIASWQSEVSVLDSIKDFVAQRWPSLTSRRWVAAVLWGLVAVFIFNMVFLPRTSLARDYRRIHFSQLTRDDTQRLFLLDLYSGVPVNETKKHVETLSNASHLPGNGDGAAQYVLDELKSYGLKPQRDVYYAWMMEYKGSGIEVLDDGKVVHTVKMTETDPRTNQEVPAYHEYSASGNVTAPVVFVNYGSVEDYELLVFQGVDLNNTVHITRMGGNVSTSLKVQHAEQHGALAVITYSDPFDDGLITEKNGFQTYPSGPARSPFSIERSSLLLTTKQPGDPTTPGYTSLRTSKRQSPDRFIPKIPAIPISAHEIIPILNHLNTLGPQMGWQGDLGFDYTPGPSIASISLHNLQTTKVRLIKNIMYTIPGLLSDTIIIGANRDTLTSVNGATSAHSGTATLLEISRAFARLTNRGWRPLRTIVVASWDGEEAGRLGSTEFGESMGKEFERNGIAYVGLDGVHGDELEVVTHPLLSGLLYKTAGKLKQDVEVVESPPAEASVFQHHLGIPTCSIGFASNHSVPFLKNSAFDTPDRLEQFIDPGYARHRQLTKYAGLLIIELSEHEVLSYSTLNYIKQIDSAFQSIVSSLPERWLTRTVSWRRKDISLPLALQDMFVSLEQLKYVANVFDQRALDLQEHMSVDCAWFKFYVKLKLAFETKLMDARAKELEKTFNHKGLVNREWFKSVVYAPDGQDGGETVMLPGLKEAVDNHHVKEFEEWMRVLDRKVSILKKKLKVEA